MEFDRKHGIALILSVYVSTAVWAHGDGQHKSSAVHATHSTEETAFGKPAEATRAARTMHIDMSDTMRFTPAELRVKQGEAVRFVVKNSGKTMHEMVLGTMKDLKAHAALMRKFPSMEHDEPYMLHVAPGAVGNMGWQFTKPGTFYYGCLIPGHFEAGMFGQITVQKRKGSATRQ